MTRKPLLAALILPTTALSTCSMDGRGADEVTAPIEEEPTAVSAESRPASTNDGWACSPQQIYAFATDPVVYAAHLTLAEVGARLDAERVDVGTSTERFGVVTLRNERGHIVSKLELERSKSVGWHVERGRAC